MSSRSLARLLVALTLLSSAGGCVAFNSLGESVAIRAVLLGTELDPADFELVDVPDLDLTQIESISGLEALVYVADVRFGGDIKDSPVTGATVTISGPGFDDVPAVEQGYGLYRISTAENPDLRYEPLGNYSVTAVFGGEGYGLVGPMPEALDGSVPDGLHAAGSALLVDLPAGYGDQYDQLLGAVVDGSGSLTWDNRPTNVGEWVDFIIASNTPPQLAIPGTAFSQEAQVYGVGALGLARSRSEATFSANINHLLSGYLTGAGLVLPVVTAGGDLP